MFACFSKLAAKVSFSEGEGMEVGRLYGKDSRTRRLGKKKAQPKMLRPHVFVFKC